MTDYPLHGGCLCGAVRYEITSGILESMHCHCRMCQLASGAPLVTWMTVDEGKFNVTDGVLKFRRSSVLAERGFCPDCGTQIVFRYFQLAGKSLDVTSASLDNPEAVQPTFQVFADSRLGWMRGFDSTLPERSGEIES